MKILFLCTSLYVGGSSKVIVDLAVEFKSFGHDVAVLSFRGNSDKVYLKLLRDNNVKLFECGRKNRFDFSFIKRAKEFIKNYKPEIISSHLTATLYYSFFGYRGLFFHTIHAKPSLDLKKMHRFFLKRNIKKGRIKLIACSESIKEEAESLYKQKIFVATNGLNMDIKTDSENKTYYYDFLFVGRLDKCKNIEMCINSFNLCLREDKNLRLCICGNGEEKTNLLNLVHSLNIEKNVDFVFNCSDPIEYYEKSKIFCLFSFREGAPIVLLEAIRSELPIVCSDIPGNLNYAIPDINALVFDPNNMEQAYKKMMYLIKNTSKINEMRIANRKIKNNFSISTAAKKYIRIFEENLKLN